MIEWRTAVATLVSALLVSCASASVVNPSVDQPVVMCHITCPNGSFFPRQHLCKNGRRWFEDRPVIGEYSTRGADGQKLTDVWIACMEFGWNERDQKRTCARTEDWPKEEVERGACDSYIRSNCMTSGNCAAHPGEPDPRGKR